MVPRLPFERRGSKLYLPGAVPTLGGRGAEAADLETELAAAGVKATKVDDDELARFLEASGRLVRLGDGYVVGAAAFEVATDVLLTECRAADGITLARFRDLARHRSPRRAAAARAVRRRRAHAPGWRAPRPAQAGYEHAVSVMEPAGPALYQVASSTLALTQ